MTLRGKDLRFENVNCIIRAASEVTFYDHFEDIKSFDTSTSTFSHHIPDKSHSSSQILNSGGKKKSYIKCDCNNAKATLKEHDPRDEMRSHDMKLPHSAKHHQNDYMPVLQKKLCI